MRSTDADVPKAVTLKVNGIDVSVERQPPRTYVSGEAHYFRGDLYRLKVETDDRAAPGVSVKGDYLVLVQRPGASAARRAEILFDWYKAQLAPLLDRYVAKWEPVLGVRPDVTCFVNGLPLAFVEVKKPNSREGRQAGRDANLLAKSGYDSAD